MKTFLLVVIISGGALGAVLGVHDTEQQLHEYQIRILGDEMSDFERSFLVVVRDRFWENRALHIAEWTLWGSSPGGVAWAVMWLMGRAFRTLSRLVSKPATTERRGSALAEIVTKLESRNACAPSKEEG